ncbi:hypothetical protein [Streptomyces longisporoflavus]|uniref:Uncharacterized protein n=1 Tax=Streptomyces longisporoflavus TaxID=28044 RepID=A0ABW7QRD9_9ACTN
MFLALGYTEALFLALALPATVCLCLGVPLTTVVTLTFLTGRSAA